MITYENSTDNQKQFMDKVIGRDIEVCQSSLVEECFKKEVFDYEDIENQYIDHSEELERLNEYLDTVSELEGKYWKLFQDSGTERLSNIHDCYEREVSSTQSKIDELEEEQEEPAEIFEWWSVSKWLSEKLRAEGEVILDNGYGIWWGRCSFGQAIALDCVMWSIYQEGVEIHD